MLSMCTPTVDTTFFLAHAEDSSSSDSLVDSSEEEVAIWRGHSQQKTRRRKLASVRLTLSQSTKKGSISDNNLNEDNIEKATSPAKALVRRLSTGKLHTKSSDNVGGLGLFTQKNTVINLCKNVNSKALDTTKPNGPKRKAEKKVCAICLDPLKLRRHYRYTRKPVPLFRFAYQLIEHPDGQDLRREIRYPSGNNANSMGKKMISKTKQTLNKILPPGLNSPHKGSVEGMYCHEVENSPCEEPFSTEDLLARLPCGHIFHRVELQTWVAKRIPDVSCPVCRHELPLGDLPEWFLNSQHVMKLSMKVRAQIWWSRTIRSFLFCAPTENQPVYSERESESGTSNNTPTHNTIAGDNNQGAVNRSNSGGISSQVSQPSFRPNSIDEAWRQHLLEQAHRISSTRSDQLSRDRAELTSAFDTGNTLVDTHPPPIVQSSLAQEVSELDLGNVLTLERQRSVEEDNSMGQIRTSSRQITPFHEVAPPFEVDIDNYQPNSNPNRQILEEVGISGLRPAASFSLDEDPSSVTALSPLFIVQGISPPRIGNLPFPPGVQVNSPPRSVGVFVRHSGPSPSQSPIQELRHPLTVTRQNVINNNNVVVVNNCNSGSESNLNRACPEVTPEVTPEARNQIELNPDTEYGSATSDSDGREGMETQVDSSTHTRLEIQATFI